MYSTIREARSSEVYRLHDLRPMDAYASLGPMHLWSINACVLANPYASIKHYTSLDPYALQYRMPCPQHLYTYQDKVLHLGQNLSGKGDEVPVAISPVNQLYGLRSRVKGSLIMRQCASQFCTVPYRKWGTLILRGWETHKGVPLR